MGLIDYIKRALSRNTTEPFQPYAPTLEEFINAQVTPSDLARKYGPLPKATTLLKYFLSCTEASTCGVLNAKYCAQFTPRMYRRGSSTPGLEFDMRQRKVRSKHLIKRLRDSNPETGVGSVARYANNAGSDDIYEIVDHPWLKLYNQPNPYEPAFLYWQMDFLQRQIFGNSYSVIFMGDDGLPEQMRHIAAQHARVVPSKDNLIESFAFQVPGMAPTYYTPDCIAHFKAHTSVVDYFYGVSWMERCLIEMDLLISAKAVEKTRFDKGLRSEFAVLMPEYNPVQKEAARQELELRGTGVKNSGGFFILPGASSITPLTMNNRDMQYNEGMKRAAQSIYFCAGVPDAFAAVNTSNLAGGLLADGLYKQVTIQPELCNNAQQLTSLVNRLYGHAEGDVWIAYDEIVNLGDVENEKQSLAIFAGNGIRLDEFRQRIKYDPIGDDRGGKLACELTAATMAPPPGAGVGEHPLTPVNRAREDAGMEKPTEEENNYKDLYIELPEPKPKALPARVLEAVSLKSLHEAHRLKSDAWEYPFSKSAYLTVNKGVEDWWKSGVDDGRFDPLKLENALKPLSAVFQEGGQDGIASLMSVAGGSQAVATAGISFDVLTPEVANYILSHTIKLASAITAEKNAQLSQAIYQSIAQGMNTQEATKEIQRVLTDRTQYECERIARTESSNAYSQGTIEAWKASGVTKKQMILAPGCCDLCIAIAEKFNEPVPINHVYFAKGSAPFVVDGHSYTNDYADLTAPPFHPNCRCSEVPVL